MKKNKTMAYSLAALLLVGGTFVGTKALFTDEVPVVSELSISTGDVDLHVTSTDSWNLVRNGEELGEGTTVNDSSNNKDYAEVENLDKIINKETTTNVNFANNLKYGDVLTKTVTIKNVGTLKATNLLITENTDKFNENNNLPTWITATTGEIKKGETPVNATTEIEPGDVVTVELRLEINSKATGKHNEQGSVNSDEKENEVINLKDTWKLTAQQVNKK